MRRSSFLSATPISEAIEPANECESTATQIGVGSADHCEPIESPVRIGNLRRLDNSLVYIAPAHCPRCKFVRSADDWYCRSCEVLPIILPESSVTIVLSFVGILSGIAGGLFAPGLDSGAFVKRKASVDGRLPNHVR
jgi:hypothetical protein